MLPINSIKILGVRVDKVTWSQIDDFCQDAFKQKFAKQIVTVNGEFVLTAQTDQHFRIAINDADLVVPDSTNVVWASRYIRTPLPQLTPGSDLTVRLAKLAEASGKSVFLLGAQEGIAQKAAEALKKICPKLIVAGTSSADPTPETVEIIKKAQTDVLFVAYPAPVQVTWIADNKKNLPCKIIVGVGGTFDMLAGTLPRAPKFLRLIHMEWLWRLIIQPSRLGRTWKALVVFPLKVLIGGR